MAVLVAVQIMVCKNTREFCESSGDIYADGGGGGDHEYVGYGGSGNGAGGRTGGGQVGGVGTKPAVPNTGSGGSFACGAYYSGASGIVIIRNTR